MYYDLSTCMYCDHSTCMYYEHSTCIAGGARAARPRFAGGLGAARPQFAGGGGGRHASQFQKIKSNFGYIFFVLQIWAYFFENIFFYFVAKSQF